MKILMLHTHDLGIGHYRMWGPAKALADAGHDVTWFKSANGKKDALYQINEAHGDPFAWLLKVAPQYDVIHWGYSTMLYHIELAVALRNVSKVPFVVDFDDDIYNVPSYNMAFKQYHPGAPERRVVRLNARVADALSVSTRPLLGEFHLQGDNPHIYHLPNLHAPEVWDGLQADPRRSDDESIRILFAGGLGRFGDLSIPEVREAIEATMAHYNGLAGKEMVRLFFVGCAPDWAAPWMQHATDATANRAFFLKFCPLSTYFQMLKWVTPDIVINPVECNQFNASKSAIKGLEAGAVGAAFVCTDWSTHDVIPNDACLKVANTRAQWTESLGALIEDAALRNKLAARLGQWTDANTYRSQVGCWVSAYERVIAAGAMDNDAMYRVLHKGVENASSGGSVELSQPVNEG